MPGGTSHVSFPWSSVGPIIAVFGVWVVGLVGFAVRTAVKGRYRVPRVDQMGGTRLLGSWLMEYGYWMVGGLASFCIKTRVRPNVLTGLSLVLSVASAVAIVQGRFGLGGWLLIASAIFDLLDGMVARVIDVASDAGEFIDSVIDRYSELFFFIALMGYYFPFQPIVGTIVGLAVIASIMISFNRAKGEAQGISDLPSGLMRRHERALYLGVGTAFSPIPAVWLEPSAAHPVYHFAVAAYALVALMGNISAVKLARQVHRRLREQAAEMAAAKEPADPPAAVEITEGSSVESQAQH
jgi:CDP-diacylglycerol---glycerol-3-phosphate 3-phosphatidyltransferase